MGVSGLNFIAALDLQRAVIIGSCTGGRSQGAGEVTVAAGYLVQCYRLRITCRRYRNHYLHRARGYVGIVHSDVQRVTRLEAWSRRLEGVIGEEVHLRTRCAGDGGDFGRDCLRRALVIGLVLVGGRHRVAGANRDGTVARDGGAGAVGVDGAGEETGIPCDLGKRYLLGLGGLGVNRQYERAFPFQVRVMQRYVQGVAGSELRYFGIEGIVGEPHRARGSLICSGRLEHAQVESRCVRRPAGFAGVVLRRVRKSQSRCHNLDGESRARRYGELEDTLAVEAVLVGGQWCRVGVHGAHAGLGHRVAGGVLDYAGHAGVLSWRLQPVVGAGSGFLIAGVGIQVDRHYGVQPDIRHGSRAMVVPYAVHGSGGQLVAALQALH